MMVEGWNNTTSEKMEANLTTWLSILRLFSCEVSQQIGLLTS